MTKSSLAFPKGGITPLEWLAERINLKHVECQRAVESAVYAAKEAGDLLLDAKGRCRHGEWLTWLKENFEGTSRQAQKYMRLAEHWDEILLLKANSDSHLTIEGALTLIAETEEAPLLQGTPEIIEGELVEAEPEGNGFENSSDAVIETPSESITTAQRLDNPNAHDIHLTPPPIVKAVVACLGQIDLDPCSNSGKPNIPARHHYTLADDGLSRAWSGKVYMNPPYSGKHGSSLIDWVHRLCLEHGLGNVPEAIALVPAYTDTAWWAELDDYPVCLIRGRVVFMTAEGKPEPSGARFPSAVFYLGERIERFYECFAPLGSIWQHIEPGMFGA